MSMKPLARFTAGVLLCCAVLLVTGCGGNYRPPKGEAGGTILLVNRIHPPGFNVWVDKKKADFLDEDLAVRVEPGNHKIKLVSKCTSLKAGVKKQDERIFDYEVRVDEGDTEKVLLAWDHPGYRYKEGDWEASSKAKAVHPADALGQAAFAPGVSVPTRYPGFTSSEWGTNY